MAEADSGDHGAPARNMSLLKRGLRIPRTESQAMLAAAQISTA